VNECDEKRRRAETAEMMMEEKSHRKKQVNKTSTIKKIK